MGHDRRDADDGDDAESVLGTMQMPRGGIAGEAAPISATLVENTASPPTGAPPEMPPERRYTYGAEIARGGMGRVVEATDTLLGRSVALKEALSLDPEAVRRFERETRITARLEHPSIVPVHDAGTAENGSPFYVMRKIGGRPLEELVAHAPELGARLALLPHIVASAHAIAHAHERGVVHRDIKPSNILAGELGETTVIDWGLAKAIGEHEDHDAPRVPTATSIMEDEDPDAIKTRAGIVFGTPGFMAPEQLRGAPPDERCDVYALGATLYHLLARRPPHYSKNGADMMRAAVDGPPTPLRQLVPGVPPALATIVDKALAHDRNARYPDARALADDLQRFLTGQLVASHHYSRREKLAHFLRQNRGAVAVAATAAVVLLVFGSFSISRIIASRDRADDQAEVARTAAAEAVKEKQTAVDSLNQLTLADARTIAMTEPTRAAALVKPLIRSKRWREVRDVVAAARANGIAFALPASPHTLSLELSRDGQHAIAAGDDGLVRLYDLTRKEPVRVLYDAHVPSPACFGDAEHTVVLFHDTHVTLVDLRSGAHRDVETPTPVAKLEVAGPIAYYLDPQKQLWKLDLAGGAPTKVELDEPIDTISPSPDGRWVALAGAQHLLLIDRTSTQAPAIAAEGAVRALAWQPDTQHLVAFTDDDVMDIAMEGTPTIIHRFSAGTMFGVAVTKGRLIATTPSGVMWLQRGNAVVRATGVDFTLGLHAARDDVVVAGRPTGLTVLTDQGDLSLVSPVHVMRIETSARGGFVVGAADGKLVVWDLDAVLPQAFGEESVVAAGFVTGDQLIATHFDGPAEWIDLRTNQSTQLGPIAGLLQLVGAPDGHRAIVIDATHHGRIVAPVGEPIDLGDDLELAAFVEREASPQGDARLVLGTSNGAVKLDGHVLVQRTSAVTALATSASQGGWIAAGFADRTLWRINLVTHTAASIEVDLPIQGALALGPDGDLVFGTGTDVRSWRGSGEQLTLAHLGRTVTALTLIGDGRALAITHDGSATILDVDRPRPTVAVALPLTNPTFARDGGLVGSLAANGSIDVFDPIVGQRWSLAEPRDPNVPMASQTHHAFVRSVALAPDGRRLLAITTGRLLVWTLALPPSVETTVPWVDALTNAIVPLAPTGAVDWTF